jgi:deoxyribodipyrimidine photolyase-related protein
VILLVLPHQIFDPHPGLALAPSRVILLEDSLFFGDKRYPLQFHKQKLWLHRAAMKRYQARLQARGHEVDYIDHDPGQPLLLDRLRTSIGRKSRRQGKLCVVDPTDFVLEKRIRAACQELGLDCEWLPNPGFINSPEENRQYRSRHKRWFMADFYKWQRRRLGVLMDGNEPAGGQWSFDRENRRKVPKTLLDSIPGNLVIERDAIDWQAVDYVETRFPDHPGRLDELYYPSSHESARQWLQHFLRHRFERFGAYEDAIVEHQSWLWHSVLTPALNIGLLTPAEVVQAALGHTERSPVPLHCVEGFIRQVIGWREFVRATYQDLGVPMRTTNHWQHQRSMPKSFYNGTTGIAPIDDTISRILATGYCHHIERLMVLGGFMFLCEIDPDEVYRWFMELFVDSYDWVMVPNVYGMSQHADGGLITTKPYFSGSSYIRKMSHYRQQEWCTVWDGLYWRWIWNHRQRLEKNPRWAMMCNAATKMDAAKLRQHVQTAERFLRRL